MHWNYKTFFLYFTLMSLIKIVFSLEKKKLLMIIFPGGTSHNFVIKSLFNYTTTNQDKYQYEYHIIVHNIDYHLWDDLAKEESYFIYNYGNVEQSREHLMKSLEMMNSNPNFGFLNFNKGMIFHCKEFMESGLLEKLKGQHFDAIATDVPTFIHVLLANELKIKNKIYISPPAIPQIFYGSFELNPSYTPSIGTKYTDIMSFSERFKNFFFQNAAKIMFAYFQYWQSRFMSTYGYELGNEIHFVEAMHFFQYPLAFAFPISIPPNFVLLNSVTPKEPVSMSISDPKIDVFLSKFKYNIYLSQGTIMSIINIQEQIDIFKYFKQHNFGFVLSFRKDTLDEKNIREMPDNVFVTRWVNQNDILGDNRIHLFITHGGLNSVGESIYHKKPMIVLGVGLDQLNTAAFIKKLNLGVVIQDKNFITPQFLINSIHQVIGNQTYIDNVKEASSIMRDLKDPRKEFKFWLDFGYSHGYEPLVIDMFRLGNWITINGFDVFFVFSLIVLVIIYLTIKFWLFVWRCMCGTCESKSKKRRKIE